MSSSTLATTASPPHTIPIKFRRKSLTASDVDSFEYPLSQSPPSAYSSSSPRSASYSSSSFAYPIPYAHDYVSASSSPVASSAVLSSTLNSPVEKTYIRYQSSPIHGQGYEYTIRTRDNHEDDGPYGFPMAGLDHASKRTTGSHYIHGSYGRPLSPLFPLLDGPHSDDHAEEDTIDMDVDFLAHQRRVSFSTSAEREKPFVRPRATFTSRTTSCPPSKTITDNIDVSRRLGPDLHGQPNRLYESPSNKHAYDFSHPQSRLVYPCHSPAMSISSLPSSDPPSSSPGLPTEPLPSPVSNQHSTTSSSVSPTMSPPPAPAPRSKSSLFALLNPEPSSWFENQPRVSSSSLLLGNAFSHLPSPESSKPDDLPVVEQEDLIASSSTTLDPDPFREDSDAHRQDQTMPFKIESFPTLISAAASRLSTPMNDLPSSPLSSPPSIRARSATPQSSISLSPLSSPSPSPHLASHPFPRALAFENPVIDYESPIALSETAKELAREHSPLPGPSRMPARSFPDINRKRKSKVDSSANSHGRRQIIPTIDTTGEKKRTTIKSVVESSAARLSSGHTRGRESTLSRKWSDPADHAKSREVDANITRKDAKTVVQPKKRRKEDVLGPVKKRPRVVWSDSESDSEDVVTKVRTKSKGGDKDREKENQSADCKTDVPASVRKVEKATKTKVDDAPSASSSTSRKTCPPPPASTSSSTDNQTSPELHQCSPTSAVVSVNADLPLPIAEMQGMLIETLAMSRASSLPASSLYSTLISNRPVLKESPSLHGEGPMSKKEWVAIIEDVLEAGRQDSGVFGKVDNSAKDVADHELEAQWFYIPEKDQDQERATLISSMMPRPAKRSATKKSKQYYWKPLGKISKWDPEDDL